MSRLPVATISRRIPKELRAPFHDYATVVGEVVWASNYTNGAFEILFSHVATHDCYQIGRAIWHTVTSDSGQLLMLKAATKASERLTDRMREKILWAIDKAQKLADSRNDAVHSATIVIIKDGKAKMAPSDIGTTPPRIERLRRDDDLKKKFHAVKGDLLQLGQYVNSLWQHVAGFDLLPALPRKPQLKSIPKQTHHKQKRGHAK